MLSRYVEDLFPDARAEEGHGMTTHVMQETNVMGHSRLYCASTLKSC